MRLTIVQYAGDYRETIRRFAAGGKATYQAQRYSVEFVGSLARRMEVTFVCAVTDERYDERLADGVRAIGLGLREGFGADSVVDPVAATLPDRLCLTMPYRPLLQWAARARCRTMLLLADSFRRGGLATRLRHYRLARRLNAAPVEWVGNHGLNSCLSLLDIGVSPDRIVPWDWPAAFDPHDRAPRTRDPGAAMRLTYVGAIGAAKGVGDLLDAVALLRDRGRPVQLTLYGRDEGGAMQRHAEGLALGDRVAFAGMIANEDVPEAMRAGDAVVVPSRHDYAEGLPLTIYEALASRTPLIASDHPMFRGAVRDGESAMVFPAADVERLAGAIATLADDAPLYARLSAGSAAAWEALQLPVRWGDMFTRWLADAPEDRRWLADHAIASGRYDARLAERRLAMAAA